MTRPGHDPKKEQGGAPELTGAFSAVTDSTRAFVALCERGIDDRAAIVGWHGTSLEAIQQALRLGGLAPSSVPHAKASAGHLFFYPSGENDSLSGDALTFQRFGRGGAMHYAEGNARHHYLLAVAGLDHANPRDHRRAFEAVDSFSANPRSTATREAFLKLGVAPEKLSEVMAELGGRRGFLIAIGKSALERYQASDGDVPGEDRKIYVPMGLSFDDIAGIEPLGDVEFTFFETLQAAVEGVTR